METRAPRRSREELRQLVVAAGKSILVEDGLRTGTDVTFKRVFDRVEADTGVRLTNASVIRRVWEDQADFQSELLASVIADFDGAGHLGLITEMLEPLLAAFDRSSPEARWASVLEFTRMAAEAAIGARVGHRNWEVFIGVWAVSITTPKGKADPQLRSALAGGMDAAVSGLEAVLTVVHEHLGVRMRDGLTLTQHCESVGAMVAGFALRQASRDEPQVCKLPTGPDGQQQEWTLFGLALEGLAMRSVELIPDWEPPD